MARKSPENPRKRTSPKKEQSSLHETKAVTPINLGSVTSGKPLEAGGFHDDMESEIRRRAYELFEERGRREGFAHEDWARAEAEVLSRFQRGKSA